MKKSRVCRKTLKREGQRIAGDIILKYHTAVKRLFTLFCITDWKKVMHSHKLGKTDLTVSEICLGTMTFGEKIDKEEAVRAVQYAYSQGVNFIDTADIYPRGAQGESERLVGSAVKGFRDKVILATKVGGPMGPGKDDRGLSRAHIRKAVDGSLARLQTDYIDLYYLHVPDPSVDISEVIETMDGLVSAGKIRYYGVSNFPAWQVCEMSRMALENRKVLPAAYEGVYNLLTRGVEDELMPFLRKYQMGFTAYNPLAGGMLTGKYTGDKKQEVRGRLDENQGYRDRYYSQKNTDAVLQLRKAAEQQEMSLVEFSYRWILSHKEVSSVIMGFSSYEQMQQNLKFMENNDRELLFDSGTENLVDAIWALLKGDRFPYFR